MSPLLDRSFDADFERMVPKLSWRPWIGQGFTTSAHRTMILGESIYLYEGKGGVEATRARIEDPDSLRHRQVTHGINADYPAPFLRNFERAVTMSRKPSRSDREALWSDVIFHNVAPALLKSRKQRPTKEQYQLGWRQTLALAELTGVSRCIVYGTEKPKLHALLAALRPGQLLGRKSLPAVGRVRPMTVAVQLASGRMDLLFIRHPSAHFSWKTWGQFLRAHDMCPSPRPPQGEAVRAVG